MTDREAHALAGHGFALRDVHAATWWERRGWNIPPVTSNAVLLTGTERVLGSRTIRRIWMTPTTLTPRPAPRGGALGDDRVLVWLQVEGTATCTDRLGARWEIPAFTHAVLPLAEMASISTESPTAHIQVEMHGLPARPRQRGTGDHPVEATVAWKALAHTVNVLLNDESPIAPSVAHALGSAVESLTHAMEREGVDTPTREQRGGTLYARAMALIDATASQPTTTVGTIADRLGVSRAHLARVFRDHCASSGTMDTPRSVILARRLAMAEHALSLDPHRDLSTVAAESGFPSARALRSARRGARRENPMPSDTPVGSGE